MSLGETTGNQEVFECWFGLFNPREFITALQHPHDSLSIEDGAWGTVLVDCPTERDGFGADVDGLRRKIGSSGDLDHIAVSRCVNRGLNVAVIAITVQADGDGLGDGGIEEGRKAEEEGNEDSWHWRFLN